jgi:outer membrane protein assembly factor BamB
MSQPKGVFNGKEWTPVIPSTSTEVPIPPVVDGDGTVFVSIATYRGKIYAINRNSVPVGGCLAATGHYMWPLPFPYATLVLLLNTFFYSFMLI